MKTRILFTTIATFALFATTVIAQIPRTISYQGVLTDEKGNFISDGYHTLTVRLYESPEGGNAVHTEQMNTTVVRGMFNAIIGSITAIPATVTFDRAYFLGISVDGANELTPRTAVTSVPYAFYATTAGNAKQAEHATSADQATSAQTAAVADQAKSLAANATGVVTSLNGGSGTLELIGSGATTVSRSGNKITISSTGGSGATGIQGVQNSDGSIAVTNPNGPVATVNVADGGVTREKIAKGAVGEVTIADGAVNTNKLQDGSITTQKILDGTIGDADIAVGGITGGKLADNAITTTKINDGAVTTAKYADNSISMEKIKANAVGYVQLISNAVGTTHIRDTAVTLNKINRYGAKDGQSIIYSWEANGLMWGYPTSNNLKIPFTQYGSEANNDMMTLQNTGAATTLKVRNSSSGKALLVDGPMHATGKITAAYTTGTENRAIPIAYGSISSAGALNSGTPNVTVSYNSTTKVYEITIAGENYYFSNYAAIVTPTASSVRLAVTSSVSNKLLVRIYDGSNALVAENFSFIVYKP